MILLARVFASARMLTHGGSVLTPNRDREEADRRWTYAHERPGQPTRAYFANLIQLGLGTPLAMLEGASFPDARSMLKIAMLSEF